MTQLRCVLQLERPWRCGEGRGYCKTGLGRDIAEMGEEGGCWGIHLQKMHALGRKAFQRPSRAELLAAG